MSKMVSLEEKIKDAEDKILEIDAELVNLRQKRSELKYLVKQMKALSETVDSL